MSDQHSYNFHLQTQGRKAVELQLTMDKVSYFYVHSTETTVFEQSSFYTYSFILETTPDV